MATESRMRELHCILPWPIDDPRRPSGGNRYDRRIIDGLRARGWRCDEHVVADAWPQPGRDALTRLGRILADLGTGAEVLIDGVMAPPSAEILTAAARRLRVVALAHMPFGEAFPDLAEGERRALAACAAIVTTSGWTRQWIVSHHALPGDRIHVATPGSDRAPPGTTSIEGNRFLCVANVSRLKGHDLLIAALATLGDLAWRCTCVGACSDASFTGELRAAARAAGIDARVRFAGALSGAALDAAYADADVLVLASRRESFGMVVGEALARGLPVIATDVGGIGEAMGHADDGALPGMLVAPGSATPLAAALRAWLADPDLRARLRRAAAQRRTTLMGWDATTELVEHVIAGARNAGVHSA